MENVADSSDVEAENILNEGDQALLDMMQEKHDLSNDAKFAMWLRVPMMESKQKFALAGFVVITPLVWLLLGGSVPIWALAIFTAVAALAVGAMAERDVLSVDDEGLKLHKPDGSKVGAGTPATLERDGAKVTVNGSTYAASKVALDSLENVQAAA